MTYNPSPDRQHDAFFKWVGICITEWAGIEYGLLLLCGKTLNIHPKLVAITYYSTPSLEGRLKLADSFLRTMWQTQPGEHGPTELTTWKQICKRIRELTPVRNRLAHGVASSRFNFEKLNENDWSLSLGIMSPRWENLKTEKVEFIRQDAMERHSESVHALSQDILAFSNHLGNPWPEKWLQPRLSKVRATKSTPRQRRDNNVVALNPRR